MSTTLETKVSLVLLGTLGALWAGGTLAEPAAALDPAEVATDELAALEDAFALDRGNGRVARELADRYLELHAPRQAVAVLSNTTSSVREDPAILHRLAMAYEETGRMSDAAATARLARARCARALGTGDASDVTPVPEHPCTERTYASLDVHASALGHMARWGVTDVQRDERARQAYVLAVRSARIVSASAEH
ncbi:MAG: hypothetical protein KF729_35710 [Sandaracinaceae bacterium]|nr:hypothetical protein [Sandaracinaceae bacterium]